MASATRQDGPAARALFPSMVLRLNVMMMSAQAACLPTFSLRQMAQAWTLRLTTIVEPSMVDARAGRPKGTRLATASTPSLPRKPSDLVLLVGGCT